LNPAHRGFSRGSVRPAGRRTVNQLHGPSVRSVGCTGRMASGSVHSERPHAGPPEEGNTAFQRTRTTHQRLYAKRRGTLRGAFCPGSEVTGRGIYQRAVVRPQKSLGSQLRAVTPNVLSRTGSGHPHASSRAHLIVRFHT
jgi:hypothetical protein